VNRGVAYVTDDGLEEETHYNSTSGSRRDDERGVKGVRVLAVVSSTMSKRVWDTGVL